MDVGEALVVASILPRLFSLGLVFLFSLHLCDCASSAAILAVSSDDSKGTFLGDPFSANLSGLELLLRPSLFGSEAWFLFFPSFVRIFPCGRGGVFVVCCAAALHTTRGADPSSHEVYLQTIPGICGKLMDTWENSWEIIGFWCHPVIFS